MHLNAESMRLERLSVPELQAEYAGLTGEALRSRHRSYLTRRIPWRLQARAYGGLSEWPSAGSASAACTRISATARLERICRRYLAWHNQEAMSVTPNQIRELLRAAPFQPFRIHLADSRVLEVPHPEFVAIQPDGRWIIVVNPLRLGGYEVVNLPLIVSMTVLNDPPANQQAA
jgi:hypothetical protein